MSSEKMKERLVLFCAKNKITRNMLAKGAGVSRESVRRWLVFDNKYLPTLTAITYLKENYGLKADWLIGGEE